VFKLPGNSVFVDKANVLELDESFVMNSPNPKVARRDDDGSFMAGSIMKS
jgi:hypothetical protein